MESTKQNIHFAFAVNGQNEFEKKHFGDSEKFVIYRWDGEDFIIASEEENIFKDLDETHSHGSKKKGQEIIKFLKEKGVKAFVSKQFGRNIKLINQHFIPVITSDNNIEDVLRVLPNHINKVVVAVKEQPGNHKLIDLRVKKIVAE